VEVGNVTFYLFLRREYFDSLQSPMLKCAEILKVLMFCRP
jgi:hypothetical protein